MSKVNESPPKFPLSYALTAMRFIDYLRIKITCLKKQASSKIPLLDNITMSPKPLKNYGKCDVCNENVHGKSWKKETRCGHIFHKECVKDKPKCPTCDYPLVTPKTLTQYGPCGVCKETIEGHTNKYDSRHCYHIFHKVCIAKHRETSNECPECGVALDFRKGVYKFPKNKVVPVMGVPMMLYKHNTRDFKAEAESHASAKQGWLARHFSCLRV
jgi:hypothetical protein